MARVCMVVYTDLPADSRVLGEAKALVERGDEVHVITVRTALLGDRRHLNGICVHPVMRLDAVVTDRRRDFPARYARFMVKSAVRMARLHAERAFDVIQVHTMPDVLVFAAIVPKLLGAKVILDVHDLMPELYASKFGAHHRMVRVLETLERRSIAFADRAIAVHEPHLAALVARGSPEDKFSVIMNAPDTALFHGAVGSRDPGRFRLVYHGTIGSRPGLDVAVRAVALARADVPGLELVIVGDGEYVGEVARLVTELELDGVVRLHRGRFDIAEVVPLLREADAGVVPILDDAFTRYMLPVKLLEYVALGLPVIASDTATIRAYFSDDMLAFVSPGDPRELARRIVALHRDPAGRARQAAAARRFLAEHGWQREKERYCELIDSLVGCAAPGNGRAAVVRAPATAVDLEVSRT